MPDWLKYFLPAGSFLELEKKKLTYALWVNLSMACFFLVVLLIHLSCSMGIAHYTADIIGIVGTGFAIRLIKLNRIEKALKMLVSTCLAAIFFYGILVDYLMEVSVHFLRLYVTLFALEGTLLLMVSFFISSINYRNYALVFSAILCLHFAVLVRHYGIEQLTAEMISYFIISLVAINLSNFIVSVMVKYNSDLIEKINEDNKETLLQNEKLEIEVEKRTLDLQNSNKKLSDFAHIVSHDLREPLRTISSFSTILQRKIKEENLDQKAIEEYAGFIQAGAIHLDKLILEILTFSTVSIAEESIAELDMNALVGLVLHQIDNLIKESSAKVSFDNLPKAYGESLLVSQLVQNLLVNAIRHKAPERNPEIRISAKRRGTMIEFAVCDNGPGVPEELQHRIFDALYRIQRKNGQQEQGTGMGLSICKQIVEAHGGHLWVQNNKKMGATFYFSLSAVAKDKGATSSR